MNLPKEFEEILLAFRKSGILVRTIIVLSFFLSLSSLTSLAEVIVDWRGFILDAINFYQRYFVDSITAIAAPLGLNYTRLEIHTAILLSICVTVGMRMASLGQIVAYRLINERYGSDLKPDLRLFRIIAVAFPIGVWSGYGLSDPTIYPWFVALVFLSYPAIFVLTKLIMAKFDYEYFEQDYFSYFVGYYAYLLALFVIVGTLAAINSGLQQSLTSNNSLEQTAYQSCVLQV